MFCSSVVITIRLAAFTLLFDHSSLIALVHSRKSQKLIRALELGFGVLVRPVQQDILQVPSAWELSACPVRRLLTE